MTSLDRKKIIYNALEQNDLDSVVSLVQKNKRTLSQLVRFAYDKDTLVGWRAIKAIGHASRKLVKTDDEFLRITMRKLLWSLSDESGGIGWAAPEILGEIVRVDPAKFGDIIPLIAGVYEIEEKVFRPGVIYALASIAEVAPERVACFQEIVLMALVDADPLVRIYTLTLVENVWNVSLDKNLWSKEYSFKVLNIINSLKKDDGVAILYQNDGYYDIQVGEMAQKVLNNTLYSK